MATTAAYDEIADWYEHEFLGATDTGHADPLGLGDLITELLGEGTGTCLEIGCGTGVHAARVRALGRTPVGVDLSAGMLSHARARPSRRSLDDRLLDGPGPARQGRGDAPAAARTAPRVPGRGSDAGTVRRVRRCDAAGAGGEGQVRRRHRTGHRHRTRPKVVIKIIVRTWST